MVSKAAWQAAAGPYSSIFFTELPENTFLNNQYANLGIHFTDGTDFVYHQDIFADGYGLSGGFDDSTQVFDAPITAIGFEFPGVLNFVQLFNHGQLIYTSPPFSSSFGRFGGLISTVAFDSVHFHDNGLNIDNLYFTAIPAPSALALLGIAACSPARRRRKSPRWDCASCRLSEKQ